MEILRDLECVEVTFTPDDKKVNMVFFSEELQQIREISYNKQAYKNGKWVDDKERAAQIEKMVDEDTGLDWDHLDLMVGQKHDVYDCGNFNSLHPVHTISKFTEDMNGEIYQTTIKEIIDGDFAIKIRYEIDGKTYESKMTHGKYIGSMKKWFKDPQKEASQKERFKKKFGVDFEDHESLIGETVIVEVKKMMSYFYGDIKKMPKKKK